MATFFNKRFLGIIFLTLLVGMLASCGGHHRGGQHMGRMFDYVAYKLDFSDTQEQMLEKIRGEVEAIRDETKDERKAQRLAFASLIDAERLDVEQLNEMLEQHHQRVQVFSPRILPLVVTLHASLNEKQKAKISTFMARWTDRP